MKNKLILLSLTFFFYCNLGLSQDTLRSNIIGGDLIPIIAAAGGFSSGVLEFDITYIRRFKTTDFRIKVNKNYYDHFFLKTDITLINAQTNERFTRTYTPDNNYMLSFGIAKRVNSTKLNYYFGLDANFGVNAGDYNSYFQNIGFFADKSKYNSNYVIGLTPFIGTQFFINERHSIDIELGLPINRIFGNLEYYDENEVLTNYEITQTQLGFNRILNDIRFSFYF